MKKCHACGQKIPLKLGEFVTGVWGREVFYGTVTALHGNGGCATIIDRDGKYHFQYPVKSLTRLHGYYRITERESMR